MSKVLSGWSVGLGGLLTERYYYTWDSIGGPTPPFQFVVSPFYARLCGLPRMFKRIRMASTSIRKVQSYTP